MNSIEDVYNRLQKDKKSESIKISISEDKKPIERLTAEKKYSNWATGHQHIGIQRHIRIYMNVY